MSSGAAHTQTNTSGANSSGSGGQQGSSGTASGGASGGSERKDDDLTYRKFKTVEELMEHERKQRDKREEEWRQRSNGNADD